MSDRTAAGWTVDTENISPDRELVHELWQCYRNVFDDHSDFERWRTEMFERHAARDGFRLVLARDDAGSVIGFAWGYIGERGQYWADLAFEALSPTLSQDWVGGHFEFVELGVLSGYRPLGIGRALHDALLADQRRRCLLSTADDPDDPAVRLYMSAGWRRLGTLSPGVQIMGLEPAQGREAE